MVFFLISLLTTNASCLDHREQQMCVNAGEEYAHICVWVNPLTPLFKKKKKKRPVDVSAILLQTTNLTRQKRRQRNCRGWRGGSSQEKRDKPGRDQRETSVPVSSDGEDQCKKKWEENWTLQIESANHLPEVKAQNIKGDTNVTIIFTYKTLCLSFHATKHVKWVNFVVLLFF